MAPKLDRVPYFDERSRSYPARSIYRESPDRTPTVWGYLPTPLDQGSEGACVGFAFTHELAAEPVEVRPVGDPYAMRIYGLAQAVDREMGNHWSEGASVLAGAKACQREGLIQEYRWAFGVEEVIDTIISHGPVVLGIPWYSYMYETAENGLVRMGGQKVGGHAIVAVGYLPDYLGEGEVIVWQNSWGPDYGIDGIGYIRKSDLASLLADRGEACVVTDTPLGPEPEPNPEPEPEPAPEPAPEPQPSAWVKFLNWLRSLFGIF